jgi:ketopantoate reductase
MESARPTEIDALNGAIVREGLAVNVATPFNQAITWMIQGMQHHRMKVARSPDTDYDLLEKQAKSEH